MRLQAERTPNTVHAGRRQARGLGHGAAAPMGRVLGLALQGAGDHFGDLVVTDPARRPGTGLVEQSVQAALEKAVSPDPHGRAAGPQFAGNGADRQSLRRLQDNMGPKGLSLRGTPTTQPRLQLETLLRTQFYQNVSALRHPHLPNAPGSTRITQISSWQESSGTGH